MRIWLNPDRMRAYTVSAEEVMDAINEQSVIARPGRIGQASGKQAQALEYVLVYQGSIQQSPSSTRSIIIRANADGESLRLKDVATVELGSEFFDIYSNLDGHPSAAIVLKQTLRQQCDRGHRERQREVAGIEADVPSGDGLRDQLRRLDLSGRIHRKVIHTLARGIRIGGRGGLPLPGRLALDLDPTLAVPVSLIGAFICMQMFGITINLITLFALVLAIGVVVDDAIVVVEAVHAKMAEQHLSPYAAVKVVLGEISGAVIAITLLMTAVFVPVAFMTGPVGIFYRQFSITMASSIVLSGVVALTLTPVLAQ